MVGMSAVSKLSLSTTGMPCSGDRGPLALRPHRALVLSLSAFGFHRDHRAQTRTFPVIGLDAREAHLSELLGAQVCPR